MNIQYSDISDHSEGKLYCNTLYNDANYFSSYNIYFYLDLFRFFYFYFWIYLCSYFIF